MKKFLLLVSLFYFSFTTNVFAQNSFPDKCLGNWEGITYIYKDGTLRDSVKVKHLVAKTEVPQTYIWKTEYISETIPVTKDYKLIIKDLEKGFYTLDEGNGIELQEYNFGNKLYSIFETGGLLLTSSYELINDQLIFEVTAGKKTNERQSVTNYSVNTLQRVVMKRSN